MKPITVSGMSCDGCERTVEDALRGVSGVTAAAANRTCGASAEGR